MKFELGQKIIDKIRGKNKKNKLEKINQKIIYCPFTGHTVPLPHEEKVKIIVEYFTNTNCEIFVETGTYLGQTTRELAKLAKEVHTIELSQDLHKKACEQFQGNSSIFCHQGDSAYVLPKILTSINSKPLFWLDGHYSGGITALGEKSTPIYEEINSIYQSNIKECTILIDDIRCFGTEKDYPTVEELKNKIESKWKNAKIKQADDIMAVII